MNTLEFKAAIRPQLEAQIHNWLWSELDTPTTRCIAVGFREHVKKAVLDDKACTTLYFAVELLPLGLPTENTRYIKQATGLLCDIFMIMVDRYIHVDRTCTTCLRIKAYEYRLRNMLKEVAYHALIAEESREKRGGRRPRAEKPPQLGGFATLGLSDLRFF